MQPTRRSFLQTSLATGAALGLSASGHARPKPSPIPKAKQKLDILVMGGTAFLGPPMVTYAVERGHNVTLFNRGRTNADMFKDLETIVGDRDPDVGEGHKGLVGRKFDAVIDNSGYLSRNVEASTAILAENVKQYVFISTISVYSDNSIIGMDESGPLAEIDDENLERIKTRREIGMYYGALKVLCEQAVQTALPNETTIIRPGLIVGPRDISDRFSYWPVRVAQGGEVLCPGDPNTPVQYIDVRDLAQWSVRTVEEGITGTFNATGPDHPTNIAELIYGCKAVSGGDASFTWVDTEFLKEHKVAAWRDMPVWIPAQDGYEGFGTVNCNAAYSNGLASRPLADTVRDTLDWFYAQPEERQAALSPEAVYSPPETMNDDTPKRRSGMSKAREQEVLTAWHAREAEGEGAAQGEGEGEAEDARDGG